MTIYVDHTHLGRHVTGLERITLELFSQQALAPLDVVPITSRGTGQMVATQTFGLPMRLASPSSFLLCPGFPPSPLLRMFSSRVLPYMHDDFLLTRQADLNARARLYMAAPFKIALKNYPRFLTNSRDTQRKLAEHCRPNAEITLYRPPVRNVFKLESAERAEGEPETSPLRVVALGTVEPRKNFIAAANIVRELRQHGFPGATLDIVGRKGWGDDWKTLERMSCVTLHGYQSSENVTRILNKADIFLCTSHDEGLGLPLLEAQYAGLPIVAPNAPVFHEVLGTSGIFIDPSDHGTAASQIGGAIAASQWRRRYVAAATENLARWNALAASDHDIVIDLIAELAGGQLAGHRSAAKPNAAH
ncbi:Glycosyltransferase involved in cell wall bisynthesis [Tardiphaga sp. OK246]|jgi:glycosyltransferase involved in cell wall biosynthesis|uniref:glycosyltransferase family 4 protein n=1 Tax=Tardiphaga sp. OK246 TaxID=1855307 RepID=UPI000B723DC5|nr:glycosyltransferase family 4 protein [Tardiphaga sp. OK246]SNT63729.1 Glycosyltransferase involved in cell wall bisynthesis [Tardiphaga sp. OK246]